MLSQEGCAVVVHGRNRERADEVAADIGAAGAALNNFTVSLAGSLKGVGVTANTVSPGIIMVDGLLRFGRKKYADGNLSGSLPLKTRSPEPLLPLPVSLQAFRETGCVPPP
jgi:hypothetical protein